MNEIFVEDAQFHKKMSQSWNCALDWLISMMSYCQAIMRLYTAVRKNWILSNFSYTYLKY